MRSADVVLIRSQEHDYEYRQWHEDIRLGYLVAVLEKCNYQCRVFDFAMHPLLTEEAYNGAVSDIASFNPRIVVFVMDKYPTNSPYYTSKMILKCRANASLMRAHFVVYENTALGTEKLLTDLPIDSVVIGEEFDFVKLVDAVINEQPFHEVPGIAYWKTRKEIQKNDPLPLQSLTDLPFPKHYYFDLPEGERHPYGYVGAIIASRGCYAKCTFCFIRAYEKTFGAYPWRARTPQHVVDELEFLYREHDVREFAFLDPQFFGPGKKGQEWGCQVAEEIIQRGLHDIAFSIYVRANDIKPDSLALLKRAGLYAVFIGIESFSQQVLDRYSKGVKVEDNIRAIELLMEYDIRLRMGFITFDHFTTFDELRQSIAQLKVLCHKKPHLITQPIFFQNVLAPLDDTPAGEEYAAIGAAQDEVEYDYHQLLTERQKRLNRNGPITKFADPRVAYLSEATRILASEILQRTTYLENYLSQTFLAHPVSSAGENPLDYDGSLKWFNGLTLFAITEFEKLFEKLEHVTSLDDELLDEIATHVVDVCQEYDLRYLGYTLGDRSSPVRVNVFD